MVLIVYKTGLHAGNMHLWKEDFVVLLCFLCISEQLQFYPTTLRPFLQLYIYLQQKYLLSYFFLLVVVTLQFYVMLLTHFAGHQTT